MSPRPNPGRTIDAERRLAARVERERVARGWTYDTLAREADVAGCRMQPSALYKINHGTPPRRITVDELVALSRVFNIPVNRLLGEEEDA